MRDKQDLKYTQKTLIRAFFDGFTNGVIDANNLEQDERQTPVRRGAAGKHRLRRRSYQPLPPFGRRR